MSSLMLYARYTEQEVHTKIKYLAETAIICQSDAHNKNHRFRLWISFQLPSFAIT